MSNVEVLDCRGDHHAMGVVQGEACRETLRSMHRALVEFSGLQPNQLLARVLRRATLPVASTVGRAGKRFMARDFQKSYPEQHERLLGIAEGAAIPIHHLFVGPAIEIALNRTSYRTPGGCTAIAVAPAKCLSDEAIIAKNFDYPSAALATYLARTSHPTGKASSIDITNAPLCGSHEGVNEHGLAIAYNYGSFRGSGQRRVTITTLVQETLETCRNVEEAVKYLGERPRVGGALLMLADATGAIASVELAPDQLGVRQPEPDHPWLVHANHAVTPEIKSRDVPHNAVFSRWYPRTMRGLVVQESSLRRHARATDLLAAAARVGETELTTMLADHGPGDSPGDDNTICRHGPYYQTTCSVLLFPKRRAIAVTFGAPCTEEFSTITL